MPDQSYLFEGLVTFLTSFKLWFFLYSGAAVLTDLLCFSYFPLSLGGSLLLSAAFFKFRLAPAGQEDVEGFFGPQFRPAGTGNTSEQVTIRSRLQLMKETQGHENGKLPPPCLTVVGHRGAGLDAPENSLSAIRECKRRGCTAVEFDVALTKDKVAVLFHDDNLIRIAGIDREIRDMTWAELERVDISRLHPLGEKFRGEKVPKLEEAVDICLNLGLKFIVDLKDDEATVVENVVEIFKRKECYSMGIVSSFYVKAIYEIRRRDPKIIGCMAWRPGYYRFRTWNSNWENLEVRERNVVKEWASFILDFVNDWGIRNLYWWGVGLSAILYHKDAITREETFRWQRKGIRILVWTVNDPLEKLNFVQNVQLGYLTDTLDGGEFEDERI